MQLNNLKRFDFPQIDEPFSKRQKIAHKDSPYTKLSRYITDTYKLDSDELINSEKPYHFAVEKHDSKLIKLLHKANIDYDECNQTNLLLTACKIWNVEQVQDLKLANKKCIQTLIECGDSLVFESSTSQMPVDFILEQSIFSLNELVSLLDSCSKEVAEPVFRKLVLKGTLKIEVYAERFSTASAIQAFDYEFIQFILEISPNLMPNLPYHILIDEFIEAMPYSDKDSNETVAFIRMLNIFLNFKLNINELNKKNENILLKYCRAKQEGIEPELEHTIDQVLIQNGCNLNLENIESYTKDPFEFIYVNKLLPKTCIMYLLCFSSPERIALALTCKFSPLEADTLIFEGILKNGLPKFQPDNPKLAVEYLNKRGKDFSDEDVQTLSRILQIDIPNTTYPSHNYPFHLILRKYQVWRNGILSYIYHLLPFPNKFDFSQLKQINKFLRQEVKNKVNELCSDIEFLKTLDFNINAQLEGKSALTYYCQNENPDHFFDIERRIIIHLLKMDFKIWAPNQMSAIKCLFSTNMVDNESLFTILKRGGSRISNEGHLIHLTNNIKLLDYMFTKGIDVDSLDQSERFGEDDVSGKTVLYRAIENLDVELVAFLLSKNANPLLSVCVNKHSTAVSPLELIYKRRLALRCMQDAYEFPDPNAPPSSKFLIVYDILTKNLKACEKVTQILELAVLTKLKTLPSENILAHCDLLKYTENRNLIEVFINAGVSVNLQVSPINLSSSLVVPDLPISNSHLPGLCMGTLMHRAVNSMNIPLVQYLMSVNANVNMGVEICPLGDPRPENEEAALTHVSESVDKPKILIQVNPRIMIEQKEAEFRKRLTTYLSDRQQYILNLSIASCDLIKLLLNGEQIE